MSDDAPLPGDYDGADGWNETNGLEKCPHCDLRLGGQGGHHGPVFDQRGREFYSLYDTEPDGGPYFCPDCWAELDANRRAAENESLDAFAGS